MSLFMVEWRSVDPKVSTSAFLAGAFPLPEKAKVVASVHAVDNPNGWVIVDCTSEEIYATILTFPPGVLEIDVTAVLDDAAAKKNLEKRHSGWKVK